MATVSGYMLFSGRSPLFDQVSQFADRLREDRCHLVEVLLNNHDRLLPHFILKMLRTIDGCRHRGPIQVGAGKFEAGVHVLPERLEDSVSIWLG